MRVLIAEDDKDSQELLKRILLKENYEVIAANDGLVAWEIFQREDIRLVITDWLMPQMGGLELCERIRDSESPGYVYIILVTSKEEKKDIVRAMDAGADDYVTKPYDKGELLARVRSGQRIISLEQEISKKNQDLLAEKEKSERLLLSIFPKAIADRLKQETSAIAESFSDASILFADINNFSSITSEKSPIEVVELLGQLFSAFDQLAEQHGLEKLKTIGDAYMAVGGVPVPRQDHAEAIAEMAFAMQKEVVQHDLGIDKPMQLRIGINSGPVVAGVIGTAKLAYDLWGETVNIAAQMEAYGLPGYIQVTAATYERLRDKYLFEERGEFYVKGKGVLRTYLLIGRKGPDG
jgi:class 3 adenylate cyclase